MTDEIYLPSNEPFHPDSVSSWKSLPFHNKTTEPLVNSKKIALPNNFLPGEHDVFIGRGKKCYNHSGNRTLRRIVASKLDEYSASTHKYDKSLILSSIVAQIRMFGGFVKEDTQTGLWFDVGDQMAKDKVAQTFRDALHEQYKSSTAFKSMKRRQLRKTKAESCCCNNCELDCQDDRLSPSRPKADDQVCNERMDSSSTVLSNLPEHIFEVGNPYEPVMIAEAFASDCKVCEPEAWMEHLESLCDLDDPEEYETTVKSYLPHSSQSLDCVPSSNIGVAMTA